MPNFSPEGKEVVRDWAADRRRWREELARREDKLREASRFMFGHREESSSGAIQVGEWEKVENKKCDWKARGVRISRVYSGRGDSVHIEVGTLVRYGCDETADHFFVKRATPLPSRPGERILCDVEIELGVVREWKDFVCPVCGKLYRADSKSDFHKTDPFSLCFDCEEKISSGDAGDLPAVFHRRVQSLVEVFRKRGGVGCTALVGELEFEVRRLLDFVKFERKGSD